MAAKLTRVLQKIFGIDAESDQLSQIGSMAEGSEVFTRDVDAIQALGGYLAGWPGVVVGANSPAIQDMNSLDFLTTRQLAYLFQSGVPEWSAQTEYFIGSFVSDSIGGMYHSLVNNNTAPLTDTSKWKKGTAKYEVITRDTNWVCPQGVSKVNVMLLCQSQNKLNGSNILIGVDTDGNSYVCGSNINGQLGTGNTTSVSSPVILPGGRKWNFVCSTGPTTFAISTSQDLYSWGANNQGLLGDGSVTAAISSPQLVPGGKKWKSIMSYGNSLAMAAVDEKGDAYAWGSNNNWQLGDGTNVNKSTPTLVLGGLKWRSVALGGHQSLGLAVDGSLYAWGANGSGALGTGIFLTSSSPILVLGGHKWSDFSAGQGVSCGITSNGDLYAWGANQVGQLGTGDVIPRSTPTLVLGGKKWKSCYAGSSYILAIDENNDMYGIGAQTDGVLGNNKFSGAVSSPVLVLGGKKWQKVASSGLRSVYGCTLDGDLYAWGVNPSGQLGIGSLDKKSTPTLVLGGLKWQSQQSNILNKITANVTGGETYAIRLTDQVIRFGAENLWSSSVFGVPQIVIEYPS